MQTTAVSASANRKCIRARRILSAALCGGISLGSMIAFSGCQKLEGSAQQADRDVNDNLTKSVVDSESGGEKGAQSARSDLQKAAGISQASSAARIRAKSALARDEFNDALKQIHVITQQSLQIDQALWDLHQAGAQILGTQQTNGNYAKLEPKEALAKLEENRAAAKTALDKATSAAAAVKSEIDKRQKEIDGLKEQRRKAESEADALAEKSSTVKGDESVKIFTQSTEARAKAGALAAQIESKTAALMPLQRTLAMAEQQQKLWDNADKNLPGSLQQLDDSKQQLDAGWQGAQQQMQAMNDLAKKINASVITPGKNNDRPNAGEKLVSLVASNKEKRDAVAKLLTDSATHYKEAADLATALHRELSSRVSDLTAKSAGSPDIASFKSLIAAYDEQQFILQQGAAQLALADLRAAESLEAQHRKQTLDELAKILQGSSLQLPAEFAAVDTDSPKKLAADAYRDAQTTLEKVTSATNNSEDARFTKKAAHYSLLLADRGRATITADKADQDKLKLDAAAAKEAEVELPAVLKSAK